MPTTPTLDQLREELSRLYPGMETDPDIHLPEYPTALTDGFPTHYWDHYYAWATRRLVLQFLAGRFPAKGEAPLLYCRVRDRAALNDTTLTVWQWFRRALNNEPVPTKLADAHGDALDEVEAEYRIAAIREEIFSITHFTVDPDRAQAIAESVYGAAVNDPEGTGFAEWFGSNPTDTEVPAEALAALVQRFAPTLTTQG